MDDLGALILGKQPQGNQAAPSGAGETAAKVMTDVISSPVRAGLAVAKPFLYFCCLVRNGSLLEHRLAKHYP